MAIAEAAAIVTTLKSVSDLVDKLRHSDDRAELRNGVSALTDMLFTARGAALGVLEEKAALLDERAALNDRIKSLESEVRQLVEFDENSEKYQRVQVKPGRFVYRERNPLGGNAGSPDFCPKCFADKKISILQQSAPGCWKCYSCTQTFYY